MVVGYLENYENTKRSPSVGVNRRMIDNIRAKRNDIQYTAWKTKDSATRTPQKTVVALRCHP